MNKTTKRKKRESYLTPPVKDKNHLPREGVSRAQDILPFLPFSRTTLHEWSKDGRFPRSVRLSDTAVGWRNAEVLDWIESFKAGGSQKMPKPKKIDNASE